MKIDNRPVQWIGVALLVGWTALLVAGLPRVAAAIPAESTVAAGTAISLAGVGITPAEGWGIDKQAATPVLRK